MIILQTIMQYILKYAKYIFPTNSVIDKTLTFFTPVELINIICENLKICFLIIIQESY